VSHGLFAPPVQRSLHSDVYDALRQALVQGILKSGERVNEVEIARRMQISRAPVREAIRQLEQEGLLVNVPRRGAFVVTLSADDVEEVYTLRAELEALAVRRALPRLTAADFAALERLTDEMQAAASADDISRFLEADIQFHRTIIEAAGWRRLQRTWESLHPQTLTLYTVRTLTDWSLPNHAVRHQPLLAALRGGDGDLAAAAIRDHILGVGAEVMRRAAPDAPP
jgi:DNA-binding GntR family transcriptional regulator